MKIDFSKKLVDMDGKNIPGITGKDKTLSLDQVCVNALLSEQQGEQILGEQKLQRYLLAKKIYGVKVIDIKTEDIVLIKDRVGKIFLPLIVGQTYEILEGKDGGTHE